MISVGGCSYSKGIEFSSHKYNVKFTYSQGDAKLFLRENPGSDTFKRLGALRKIPFVRGVMSLIKTIKYALFFLIWDVMILVLPSGIIDSSTTTYTLEGIIKMVIIPFVMLGIALTMLILILVKNFHSPRSTWSYHGAEHKVIYTNNQNVELTLENCRKAPRISDNCGTMICVPLAISFILVTAIASLCGFNMLISVSLILSYSFAYEVFLLDRNTPVFRFFFKIGYWLQSRLFTCEPSNTQLNLAIDAFKLLEMAETDQIPKEELENLLKSKNALNIDVIKTIIKKETVAVS